MKEVLHLLLVEDSDNDAELVLRELRRAGFDVNCERVETAAGLREALQRREWDLIISDYVLPGFSGVEALALYREKGLNTPFIIVSGHIAEDVAVEAMKAGAADYVMKDRLARLAPAVRRELREAKTREARLEAERRLQHAARELSESRSELEKRVLQRTADLAVANAELQCQIQERVRLERELLDIAENERRRLGLDLHDDLSQKLMGVAFMVKALERKVASKHLPRLVETRKIQSFIHEVINHTQDFAHDFAALESQGDDLAAELKTLAANVKKMFAISCQFSCKGEPPRLPAPVISQLYKIAQESAGNAVRHGKATLVSFCLHCSAEKLVLTIKNNGFPFPEGRKNTVGMGLRIMHSRASMIGAAIDIRTDARQGAMVTCTLPLMARANRAASQPPLSAYPTSELPCRNLAIA